MIHNYETKHSYGWIKDLPDFRDLHHSDLPSFSCKAPATFPAEVDLYNSMPPPYDQGQLGSCTANAIAGAIEYDFMKNHQKVFMPSRLYIYYNERAMENTINSDSGAQIRDGIKSCASLGVCSEDQWAYNIKAFKQKPNAACYTEGSKHKLLQYAKVNQTLDDFRTVLSNGYPIIFGAVLYESFESLRVRDTGVVPMPNRWESVIGGHAILITGYNDTTKRFMVRNSWGDKWGAKGYCFFPYEYIMNPHLCGDFWVIQSVDNSPQA